MGSGDFMIGLGAVAAIAGGALLTLGTGGLAAPIGASMVAGGISMASTGIGGNMTESSAEKQQEEDRRLAGVLRKDKLKQLNLDNALSKKSMKLMEESSLFNREIAEGTIAEKEAQKKDLINKQNYSYLTKGASNLSNTDENMALRNRLNRMI